MALFISIAATGILEMQWGGVSIDDWWRNEQFWVIGGVSSHLFALFQGLLKVLAGVETNFTVTSKGGDDGEFAELYLFKWTSLLIPPMTLLILNIIGVIAGISNAISNGYESWGPLFAIIGALIEYVCSRSHLTSSGSHDREPYAAIVLFVAVGAHRHPSRSLLCEEEFLRLFCFLA
ncbi:hypothetical protein BHM03_00008231 [Ensete ventricosum]|nr:hypothetical protein BHM03_00008231 [Ensete ventricosum]